MSSTGTYAWGSEAWGTLREGDGQGTLEPFGALWTVLGKEVVYIAKIEFADISEAGEDL